MPSLLVKLASGATFLKRLPTEGLAIGRVGDLALGDPALSRLHVEIRPSAEGWVVRDLDSRNGTLLGGRRLAGTARLAEGDEVRAGSTAFVFLAEESGVFAGITADGSADALVGSSAFLGASALAAEARRLVSIVGPSDTTVLILGESGTGKELLARAVHAASPRRDAPFVVVNCPAIPPQLFESEIFGIERGVATGVDARRGLAEAARGGTLFFDEVGDLAATAQAKLLRFIQERTLDKVGARTREKVDVRIVAATNRDLDAAVADGSFRQDLYFRLSAFPVRAPRLRDRRDDIHELVTALLAARKASAGIDVEALALLAAHDWPGNVRELENAVERAVLLSLGARVTVAHLPAFGAVPRDVADSDEAAALVERLLGGDSFWTVVRDPFLKRELSRDRARLVVTQGLARAGGSYKEMARLMGLQGEYKKLMNFLRNHGLQRDE